MVTSFSYNRAIEHYRTPAEMARRLNVTPAVVNNWRKRGIPIRSCIKIEVESGGVRRLRDLRPELFRAVGRGPARSPQAARRYA